MKDQTVMAVRGDITKASVDVIVNAANEYLRHGGGLAAALAAAGGEEFVEDSDRWVSEHGPVPSGEAAVTVGGRLQAPWVVHVVGPRYREGQDNPALLRQAVRAALDASARVEAETVAMPAISTGVFGYPLEAATRVIASECVRWVREHPGALREVRLVGYDRRTTDALRHGLDSAIAEGPSGEGGSG
ncbi:MAG: macro domain-containing protein [bacterium]|nr:macro domain-containing protein [bacterium]MDE0352379.1 macro domain-containing protein [bacterium]